MRGGRVSLVGMPTRLKVKVTRNYQVTVPAPIRERVKIREGDVLLVYTDGRRIILEKAEADISKLEIRLGGKVDWRAVEEAVRESAYRVAEEGGAQH